VFKGNTRIVFDLLVVIGFLVAINVCGILSFPGEAGAEPSKENQSKQIPQKKLSRFDLPREASPAKTKDRPKTTNHPTQHPALRTPGKGVRKTARNASPAPSNTFHGTFVEPLKYAPFPNSGKGMDPNFFDFVDPQTGERFRTTRNFERLSEKDHYCDSSVLFYLPKQFNPKKPFAYVVFFHGNRTEVRQFVKDYRLDEQVNGSGKNVILVLPQLARNAADSSPGKFSRKGVFGNFMQEAAKVLARKVGRKYQGQFERAPILLAAFSGGYKPLACALDRGGADSRIKGVLLMDALYEDLYIFGRWILHNAGASFFINIYTEGSACEEKTKILAQFLREHRLPFKEEWPKGFKKTRICLLRSPYDHLQVPVEGPPREPLAELLRSLPLHFPMRPVR
jgi:hypothetical protein